MTVVTLVCLPALVIGQKASSGVMRLYSHLVVIGLRWIVGIKVEVRGRENIPDGPVIMAGKHMAMLDIFAPFLMFRDPVIVMKRELLWYPGLGWYSMRAQMLAIDRNGTARTLKHMLKVARERVMVGKGRQIVIFPEGTRALPGAEPDYKPAGVRAFYKALAIPIVPVATNSGLCWPAHGLTRTPGTIVYEILPQIDPGLKHTEMLPTLIDALETASSKLAEEELAARAAR